MKISFFKFQGCGNDFIIIDDLDEAFSLPKNKIANLCNRWFGIGADGLILIRNHKDVDFEMVYYNSDGKIGSMCGNGSRCAVSFTYDLGLIKENCTFLAADGIHKAEIKSIKDKSEKIVAVKMRDVEEIEINSDFIFLNTGSPHVVIPQTNLEEANILEEGRKIRFNDRFKTKGTNVNFIEKENDFLKVRTYERGVEDETLSCGTGVTASAIASSVINSSRGNNSCKIKTPGGELLVSFNNENNTAKNIWLQGPATMVFKGEIEI
jgi:diaminopimelate epimerase